MTKTVHIEDVMLRLITLDGIDYDYGAEVDPKTQRPGKIDCSEAMQWTLNGLGVEFPDGAANQFAFCKQHKTITPVEHAIHTRGSLGFIADPNTGHIHHVLASLGTGRTFEAKGKDYGVGRFSIYRADGHTPRITHAALIPGVDYTSHKPLPMPAAPKDTVAELLLPDHSGGYRLTAKGGIFPWGVARFFGAYPGLPAKFRQGEKGRMFVGIHARPQGGYTCYTNRPAEHYDFGPDIAYPPKAA